MAENDEIVTPIQSPSTNNPDAPQSSMSMATSPEKQLSGPPVFDGAGNQYMKSGSGQYINVQTGQPYEPPVYDQQGNEFTKNAQGQYVNTKTGQPYQAPAEGQAPAAGPGIGQQAKDILNDFQKGVGEGGLATVHGVGEGIRQATNVASNAAGGGRIGLGNLGDKIIPQEGQASLNSFATPENTTQKVGFGAEALLEMMVGDGALKSLSLAERLTLGSKIAKMAEDYPIVGKILAHGLNAVRMGTAQTGEGIVKGQPVGEAIQSGAETAAAGTGVGALAEMGGAAASHLFNPETGKITKFVKQVAGGEGVAQRPAQIAMRNAAGETGSSVRELLTSPIERAKTTAQSGYDQVEKATGVDLKNIQQKLDNTVDEINKLTGTEADLAKEAQLEKARTELMDEIDEAKQAAAAKGVPVNAIDKADAAWKKHKALSEVQGSVFDNEGVIKGNTAHGSPEVVNVDTAIRNLEKLNNKVKYGAPRLQEAFGANGADRLMKEMYAAQREGVKAMTVQKWTKIVSKVLGYGAIAGLAGHAVE